MLHRIVEFFRRLIQAFRHVKSGGKAGGRTGGRTRTTPPRAWCDPCRRFMPLEHEHPDDEADDDTEEGQR